MEFAGVNKLVIDEGTVRRISRNGEILFKNYRKFPHIFSDLDTASLPTLIEGHKTFNGSELMLSEIVGKTVKQDDELYSVELDGIKVSGAAGSTREPWELTFTETQTLRGAGTVGDKITVVAKENGLFDIVKTVTMGSVDLGTLEYMKETSRVSGIYRFHTLFPSAKAPSSGAVKVNIISSNFIVNSADNLFLGQRGIAISGTGRLTISGENYDSMSANEFKSAISGIMAYYELANPTMTTLLSDLTEEQVATLTEKYGSIEIIGNGNAGFVKPNVSVYMDAEKIIE